MSRFISGLFAAALVAGCTGAAPTASGTPSSATLAVSGAAACPAGEQQALTFSGAMNGHVSCSTAAVACATVTAGIEKSWLVVPVRIRVGSEKVLLTMTVVGKDGNYQGGLGTFAIQGGGSAEGAAQSPATAALDGPSLGHWDTVAGGSVAVTASSAAGSAGTITADLQGTGAAKAHLSGDWRCSGDPFTT